MNLMACLHNKYLQHTTFRRIVKTLQIPRSIPNEIVKTVLIILVIICYGITFKSSRRRYRSVKFSECTFYKMHIHLYNNLSKHFYGCDIPLHDPFDKRIKPFIHKYKPESCGKPQPYLTYVDSDGFIRLNQTEVTDMGLNKQGVNCTFAEVHRSPNSDNAVTFGSERIISHSARLSEPYVKAWCRRISDGHLIYEAVHAWVPPLSRKQEARVQPSDSLRPSVLILCVDSMSRLNFIRQMPRTYALLKRTFGATVFTGFLKVGLNTNPNMVVMLSGMALEKHPNIKAPIFTKKDRDGEYIFDDLPTVWKNFSENGYVTSFIDDCKIGLISWPRGTGFREQPTDYYLRPFVLAAHTNSVKPSTTRCFGNTFSYEFLYNHTREFAKNMRGKRYFALSFQAGFSHDFLNEAQVLDDPFHELLQSLWESGALKNTVVIVMGDHGQRIDKIRTTELGRVEDSLPLLAIALPSALRAALPHLEDGLRSNSATLISGYDVYELLMDIALGNLQPASRVARFGRIGFSLFRKVPARSCSEAGVPPEYCVCVRERPLPTQEAVVRTAARALVAHVNALLAEEAWPPGACAPLTLSAVHSAQLLLPSGWVAHPKGFKVEVRVAVRVAPSDALLEGTVERGAWEPLGRVQGDVARINKYGNQSHCLRDPVLRSYCYCVDLLP